MQPKPEQVAKQEDLLQLEDIKKSSENFASATPEKDKKVRNSFKMFL